MFCFQPCIIFVGATYCYCTHCGLCCLILICLSYQVSDFTAVMEGISDLADHLESVPTGLFSCQSILNNAIFVEGSNLTVYMYCHRIGELYRSRPVFPGFSYKETLEDLKGRFHLLKVTHKFPVLQRVCPCAS